MPLSKSVISKLEAENMAIPFEPVSIDTRVSKQVMDFADKRNDQNDFRLDKIVSQITGIDEIEKASRQKEIEEAALQLSKDVQEEAYKTSYDLGFKEGKKEAILLPIGG